VDSVIAQRNDGFDKDGNFLNGQTEMLPWPDFYVNGSYYDIQSGDGNASFDVKSSMPNPYVAGEFFSISGGGGSPHYISRHAVDGSIIWAKNVREIFSPTDEVYFYHFYDDGINKWLIGGVDDSGNTKRLIKVNVETGEGMFSSQGYASPSMIFGVGTLEDGTLFYIARVGSSAYRAYLTDIETLSEGVYKQNLGYITFDGTFGSTGVSLFNGSVALLGAGLYSSTGGYSYDYVLANMAINKSLNFSSSETDKVLIRTPHPIALNTFTSSLAQLSKDIFITKTSATKRPSGGITDYSAVRFYNRAELERWVSDCIFAATGVRIPLVGSE